MMYLLTLVTAMVISMAIIPVMARIAPRVGMIDRPDFRKVHAQPIPRAGGVGIVLGSLVPIALWLGFDEISGTYLFGAVVLLIFGVWDDIQELGHYTKFAGQLIAVVPAVYFGNLYITHLPLVGMETIPDFIGKPFTVFAMIGMINAINHSDGLDGLAGGMSLLSLSCIAYLAFLADGNVVTLIALATVGGVFGFLRYNNHPARVFMGDGGSQFLGFTLAFLTVNLIERTNPALSPALPVLILGLPIIDILAVFAQRIYHRMNWFRASKNHIHHRFLQLGIDHYGTVVIIYSVQILFVVCAVFLKYESDLLILSVYLSVCSAVIAFLIAAERGGWRLHTRGRVSRLTRAIRSVVERKVFTMLPVWYIAGAVPLMFVFVGLWTEKVPRDLGIAAAFLAVVLLLRMLFQSRTDSVLTQAIGYITAAFVIYIESEFFNQSTPLLRALENTYFVLLAIAIGFAIRYDTKADFKTTPMDYLVIFIALFAGFLLYNLPDKAYLGFMAVKLIVIFYACELIFARMRGKWHVLNFSVLAALLVLSMRSLM